MAASLFSKEARQEVRHLVQEGGYSGISHPSDCGSSIMNQREEACLHKVLYLIPAYVLSCHTNPRAKIAFSDCTH